MNEKIYYQDNRDGWALEIRQYRDPDRFDPRRRPLLLIPGYCMNTFILNFHPTGESMVGYLAARGFEVWTANLRGQGGTLRRGGTRNFGFREIALVDIPTVLNLIQKKTRTRRERIDAIGCSLGATFLYGYIAHHAGSHGLGSLVAIGGPLRWTRIHPLVRMAFGSPEIAGNVPIFGTRALARRFLPVAQKFPALLSIYMNTDMIDLSAADELVQTVDDPIPYLNRQIAHWIREVDLKVGGVDVTAKMAEFERPVLAIVANADGIVPEETATSVLDVVDSDVRDVLRVGDEENWFAHADLFINDNAHDHVFDPLASWLTEQQMDEQRD